MANIIAKKRKQELDKKNRIKHEKDDLLAQQAENDMLNMEALRKKRLG